MLANASATECQCNTDWLRNQTRAWMSQWLGLALLGGSGTGGSPAESSNTTAATRLATINTQSTNHWAAGVQRSKVRTGSGAAGQSQSASGHQSRAQTNKRSQQPVSAQIGPPLGPQGPKVSAANGLDNVMIVIVRPY